MAPNRQLEEENNEMDLNANRIHWSKIKKPSKNEMQRKMTNYNMNLLAGHNYNPYKSQISTELRGSGANRFGQNSQSEEGAVPNDIPIPYIYLQRPSPNGTVILLHANAEDIFSIDKVLADPISTNLNVSF